MKSNFFTPVIGLARAYIKRTFRDKTAMFFTFLFPLIFLFVFGSLYRNNSGTRFEVVVLNRADNTFATQFASDLEKSESLEVNKSITTLDAARQKMGRGEIDSVIELPEAFGLPNAQGLPSGSLIVYYEEASPQTGQTLAAIMQGTLEGINQKLTQVTPPLSVETRSTATSNLSSFDYIFSGLIGFSMLSLGIFGLANNLPAEKKTGSLRRLLVSPLKSSQLILAYAANYLLIGILSIVIMVIAGIWIFDFQMRGDYFNFALMCILGIIMMFGFGVAIGGWAKNENQSAPLTNLVAFPLMFLSGVFFPRFLMPEWLQGITEYLPLSPVIDGLRAIVAEGKTVLDLGPELALMAIWTVAIYFVAIKIFRWE